MSKAIKIKILDSKLSNVNSVKNMIDWIGYDGVIVEDLKKINSEDRVILPGIGHFGKAMDILNERGIIDQIKEVALIKKNPILGICLGMQLLMDKSEESPNSKGLGLISGSVKKFNFSKNELKVPHVGWNNIQFKKNHSFMNEFDIKKSRYYFVHSYFVDCDNNNNVLAETSYGINFSSIINKNNIFGFQFHPEKSLKHGARLLKNFCEYEV